MAPHRTRGKRPADRFRSASTASATLVAFRKRPAARRRGGDPSVAILVDLLRVRSRAAPGGRNHRLDLRITSSYLVTSIRLDDVNHWNIRKIFLGGCHVLLAWYRNHRALRSEPKSVSRVRRRTGWPGCGDPDGRQRCACCKAVKDPVCRGARISTSKSGLGQNGTKLAVG